ncbi:PTS mannitol transporter subunit IIA [Pontibacillus yanchengensis]|uniref:PTS mannitol transporter subunit IIA n=2 Tax=Pontibacillus yanchengensis TaxID=462910 RepID=A0ACC7VC97_9BACI|nr:PTS sugar transporter subunit IIA [Pontibacillus yanchengensis]MYL35378.1 PTS mannitol transporter subunit IIA [Pontibacillus yanchengensis]MYL52407.1 PTS mannitol transporter subunit IIA [Pontibacillus yanchengensis]
MSTILKPENVELNQTLSSKEEAIRYVGEILNKEGYVSEDYIDSMIQREEVTSTYMGNYVAIPHGTEDAKKSVLETGLSVVTVPEGVDFGDGNIVKLLIGIAGKGDEHLEILSQIALVCSEEENIQKILDAQSKDEVIALFSEVN